MKCANCTESKMANVPFKNNRSEIKEILELIHTNLNGPHNTIGYGEEKYFVTFIDDYSNALEFFVLKVKQRSQVVFVGIMIHLYYT